MPPVTEVSLVTEVSHHRAGGRHQHRQVRPGHVADQLPVQAAAAAALPPGRRRRRPLQDVRDARRQARPPRHPLLPRPPALLAGMRSAPVSLSVCGRVALVPGWQGVGFRGAVSHQGIVRAGQGLMEHTAGAYCGRPGRCLGSSTRRTRSSGSSATTTATPPSTPSRPSRPAASPRLPSCCVLAPNWPPLRSRPQPASTPQSLPFSRPVAALRALRAGRVEPGGWMMSRGCWRRQTRWW